MRIGLSFAVCVLTSLASCSDQPAISKHSAIDERSAEPAKSAEPPQLLTREQFEAGWISLFDGHSLFGWRANSDLNWSVRDGVIQADKGEPGLLLTAVKLADYELRCDYRLQPGGNSGLFLRSEFDPKDPTRDCYELNVCDSHPEFPTGSIVGRQKVGTKVVGEGGWKTLHVTVEGPRIVAKLDGRLVMDFLDTSDAVRKIGHIGLQMNGGKVEFRNVSLRPLGMQSMFNGKDLSGWQTVPGSKAKFQATDGTIHVTGGPGFLETKDVWENFLLQADVKTNAPRVNSGLFFRTQQGTEDAPSHGYELQIHNGYKDGDRTQPDDYGAGFGTGAIFRRAKARRVVSNDRQWCTLTLFAHGKRFATWVNGYQVTDWTDERKQHENPRRGSRRKAGHVSLQGHDQTTDVQFRKLRVVKLPR
jgi:hypothetical protein